MASYFTSLRNRPFLIVRTLERPAKGVKTERKHWAAERSNHAIFEMPSVADRVNHKAMQEATVIIDVMQAKIVKSRFDLETDETVVNHYMTKYKAEIAEAMEVWMMRAAKDPKVAESVRNAIGTPPGSVVPVENESATHA